MRKKSKGQKKSFQSQSVEQLGESEFIISASQEIASKKQNSKSDRDDIPYGCEALDLKDEDTDDAASAANAIAIIDNVLDEINAGHFDLDPAMIGFDQYSDAIVWSYTKLLAVLTANGYCEHCADVFIQCFAQFTQPSPDDPEKQVPQNIVVLEKADNEIVGFRNRYAKQTGKDGE